MSSVEKVFPPFLSVQDDNFDLFCYKGKCSFGSNLLNKINFFSQSLLIVYIINNVIHLANVEMLTKEKGDRKDMKIDTSLKM